jgi:tetratricopeptide (TPR) repeat protein
MKTIKILNLPIDTYEGYLITMASFKSTEDKSTEDGFVKGKYVSMKLNTVFALKREKRYQEAERILSELLEAYPNNPHIKKSMADLMVKQNRLTNALLFIDNVLCSHPQDTEAMTIKGTIYYKSKRYKEAKEWFQGATRYKHSNFSLSMLIKTLIKTGEIDKALSIVEGSLKGREDNSYFLQLKAEILEAMGKTEEAIAIYEQILDAQPDNKYIYKELIKLKTQKMDRAEAAKEIETLLKVSSYSKNEHLYIQQAENYKKQKDYEKAIEAYKKGLKISLDNLFLKKQIGYCYNRLHKYEETIRFMREAFLQDPTDYVLRRTLFAAYKKMDMRCELIDLIDGMGLSGTSLYYILLNEAKK